MLLYNVTINIEVDLEEEWVSWMKSTHIPDVLATGLFLEHKFFKILHDNEDGAVNYSVQYFTDSFEKLMTYQKEHSPRLQQEVRSRYQDRLVSFRTVLESVD